MIKQLLAQIAQGFSVKDLPFLILQITASAILAWVIRFFWRKNELHADEIKFLDYLIPIQILFTALAIFSIRSPWMAIVFGFCIIIPLLGNSTFSLRSKAFYLICIFVSFGFGAANFLVTALVFLFFLLPVLYFNQRKS